MTDKRIEYVVLRLGSNHPNTSQLEIVGRVKTINTDHAIREVAAKEGAGSYVAVPARSWVPRTVELETTTAVKFAKETT